MYVQSAPVYTFGAENEIWSTFTSASSSSVIIAHADPSMDHCRALRACVASLTRVWNHQLG